MKKNSILAIAAAFATIAYSTTAYAIKTSESSSDLIIRYADSGDFRDIDLGYGSEEKNAELVMKVITGEFQKATDRYLPDGYKLEIEVLDIDLAGDRSPMTSRFGDYRVYRDIYPPRIAFKYTVYDAAEQAVASGNVRKSDLSYLRSFTGSFRPSDKEAPYVTELVKSWASAELRKAVTSN